MYGNIPKTLESRKSDSLFILHCTQTGLTRDSASKYFSNQGWSFYSKNDFLNAMKRFNQSWLLDSTNANPYWGFALIYSSLNRSPDSTLIFMELSFKHDSTNPRITLDLIDSYLSISQDIKQNPSNLKSEYISRSITLLERINSNLHNDPMFYRQYARACLLNNDKECAYKQIEELRKFNISSSEIDQFKSFIEKY
jgi:hypothetical protein